MIRPDDNATPLFHWTPYLLVLAAVYRFIDLGFGEMQQWDESLYALRTLVILRFGEFYDQSAHMLGGAYYSAHPPLYVWLSGVFAFVFGEHVWIFRFSSALAGAASVYLTYRIAGKTVSQRAALFSALFVGFHPLITLSSRQGQLDIVLMFLMMMFLSCAIDYLEKKKTIYLFGGVCALALALMTKLFFAGGMLVGMSIAYFLFRDDRAESNMIHHDSSDGVDQERLPDRLRSNDEKKKRLIRFVILTGVASLPLWLPWYISFTSAHGDGNLFYLFSSATPLGQTLEGGEGTSKSLGIFYYLNQLLVQLSFLFPFVAASVYRPFRNRNNLSRLMLAGIILLYLIVLSVVKSKFLVYLIPILPIMVILGVEEFFLLRKKSASIQKWFAIACVVFFAWSLSHEWRMSVKEVVRALMQGQVITSDDLLRFFMLLGSIILLIAAIALLSKRGKLKFLFSLNAASMYLGAIALMTMIHSFAIQPETFVDGAKEITGKIATGNWDSVIMIGDGVNPQLTYYLHGADIGWDNARAKKYERVEPAKIDAAAVKQILSHRTYEKRKIAVIVEKDEMNAGVYQSIEDILPMSRTLILDTPRYLLYEIRRGVSDAR